MRLTYPVVLVATLVIWALPIQAKRKDAELAALSDRQFETVLALKVISTALKSTEYSGRAVPAVNPHFRALDMAFLEELDSSSRKLLPDRDAWGRHFQILHIEQGWIVASAGEDGEFQFGRILEAARDPEDLGDLDTGDDLILSDDDLRTPVLTERKSQMRTLADIRSIGTAIESYSIDFDAYPCPRTGIVSLEELRPILTPVYILKLPLRDGWGNPIVFSCSAKGSYGLISYGSDGRPDVDYAGAGPGLAGLSRRGQAVDPKADIVFMDGQFIAWPDNMDSN